ncbi:OR14J1 [Branchiostoma lanceolatum]|uniref:OR14J1 protein n=1 Tax=Branchiostoma lanceolatum TaxID=7740 RepID=A0A8J9ZFN0_BRALA|nr:OR14J1 [Branchiostoma lanceolatum]
MCEERARILLFPTICNKLLGTTNMSDVQNDTRNATVRHDSDPLQTTLQGKLLQLCWLVPSLVLILSLNCLFLVAILRTKKLWRPRFVLPASLCVLDIVQGSLFIPSSAVNIVMGGNSSPAWFCWTQASYFYVGAVCTLSTLTLMAWDRYQAVCNALYYQINGPLQCLCAKIAVVWTFSVLLDLRQLKGFTAMATRRADNRRSSAPSPWRAAASPNPDLPKYHEGFLVKKFKSGYQRIWAEIKADVMFFYHPERQDQHALGYLQLDRTTTVEYPKSKGKERGQHKFIVKSNKDLHKFLTLAPPTINNHVGMTGGWVHKGSHEYLVNRYPYPVGQHRNAYRAGETQVIGAQLRDVWKAYILTIATHVVPEDLNLLPGQLIDVQRTLEQETYRLASPPPPVPPHYGKVTRSASSSSGYSSGQSGTMSGSGDSAGSEASSLPPPPPYTPPATTVEMHAYRFYPDYLKERGHVRPPWFFNLLPRDQVEQVLSDNILNGNMLLRSSESAPGGLVLSARLPVDGEPTVRHYIVNMTNGHFVLDIDKKHPPILNVYELINYFIDQSGGNVVPLETIELSELALPPPLYEENRVVKLDECPNWGEWEAKPVPKSVVNMLKYSVPPDELHKVQEMSIRNPPGMRLPDVDYDEEPTPIYLEHDDDDVHDYVTCEAERDEWVEDTQMKIPRPKLS